MATSDFPRLDKVRIFVVDEGGRPFSSAWFVDVRGNAVHAAPRDIGGGCKLVLDHTGTSSRAYDSQFGLASLHFEDTAEGIAWRRPLRWRRPATPDSGAVRVAALLFPSEYQKAARPVPKDGRPRFELPMAGPREAVEVSLFYSRDVPHALVEKFHSLRFTPLFYLALPNDEYVSVTSRQMPYAQDIAELIEVSPSRAWPLGSSSRGGDEGLPRAVVLVEPPADDEAIVLAEAITSTEP